MVTLPVFAITVVWTSLVSESLLILHLDQRICLPLVIGRINCKLSAAAQPVADTR